MEKEEFDFLEEAGESADLIKSNYIDLINGEGLKSLENWTRVKADYTNRPIYYFVESNLHRRLGDYKKAMAIVRLARKKFPENLLINIEYFRYLAARGQFLEAIWHLEGISIKTEGLSNYVKTYMAYAYAHLRDFENADLLLESMKDLRGSARYENLRSRILFQKNRFDEALQIGKRNFEKYNYRGSHSYIDVLEHTGRLDEALKAIDSLLENNHGVDGDLIKTKINIEVEFDRQKDAKASFELYLKHVPLLDRNKVSLDIKDKTKDVKLDVPFQYQHEMTCVPASLTMLARFYGKHFDHIEIAEQICYDGTPDDKTLKWAIENGFAAKVFSLTWDSSKQLINSGIPFLLSTVGTGESHMQVVIGYRGEDGLIVRDPSNPYLTEYSCKTLVQQLTNYGPRCVALTVAEKSHTLEKLDLKDGDIFTAIDTIADLLTRNKRNEAEEVLLGMQSTYGDHPLIESAKRRIFSYDNDTHSHAKNAYEAWRKSPHDANLLLFYLSTYLSEYGTRKEVDALFKKLPERLKYDSSVLTQYAIELKKDNANHEKIRQILNKALLYDAKNQAAHYEIGALLSEQNQEEDASRYYKVASILAPTNEYYAWSAFLSIQAVCSGSKAIEWLRKRVSVAGSNYSGAHSTLIKALLYLDKEIEVESEIDYALETFKDPNETFGLINTWQSLGKPDVARRFYDQQNQLVPPIVACRVGARLSIHEGKAEQALDLARKAVEISGRNRHDVEYLVYVESMVNGLQAAAKVIHKFLGVGETPWLLMLLRDYSSFEEKQEVAFLENYVTKYPDDLHGRFTLAVHYKNNGDLEAANKLIDRLLVGRGEFFDSYLLLKVDICLLEEKVDEAKSICWKILERNINNLGAAKVLFSLCRSRIDFENLGHRMLEHYSKQKTGKAVVGYIDLIFSRCFSPLKRLEILEALPRFSNEWWIKDQCIEVLRRIPDLEKAMEYAEELCQKFPRTPGSYKVRAEIHRLNGNYERAIVDLRHALTLNPDWGDARLMLVDMFLFNKDVPGARKASNDAITRDPFNAVAYGYKADLEIELEEYGSAFETLKKSVELNLQYQWAWNRLDQIAEKLEKRDNLASFTTDLMTRYPGNTSLMFARSEQLNRVEENQQKIDLLTKIIGLDPTHVGALCSLADSFASVGDFEKAIKTINQSALCEQEDVATKLVWLTYQAGNLNEAVETGEKIVTQYPNFDQINWYLFDWYKQAEMWQDALKVTDRLIKIIPDSPTAHKNRAHALYYLEQYEDAKLAALAAYNFDPLDDHTNFILVQLGYKLADITLLETVLSGSDLGPQISFVAFAYQCALKREKELLVRHVIKSDMGSEDLKYLENIGKLADQDFAKSVYVDILKQRNPLGMISQFWLRAVAEIDSPETILKDIVDSSWDEETKTFLRCELMCWHLDTNRDQKSSIDMYNRFSDDFRKYTMTWAEAGRILYSTQNFSNAAEVFSDYKDRTGLKQWMMLNYILSLLMLNNPTKAIEVIQVALDLEQEDYHVHLQYYLAYCYAVTRDHKSAEQLLHNLGNDPHIMLIPLDLLIRGILKKNRSFKKKALGLVEKSTFPRVDRHIINRNLSVLRFFRKS